MGKKQALGYAGVSPLQGSSTFSPPINYFIVLMRSPLSCMYFLLGSATLFFLNLCIFVVTITHTR